ncbi:MAG: ABC transporter substrate-binding protein [Comamonadaceae bacterium]|nr:ABC transporter substrate-binding protein [Comamonadaceae bacterium]
MMTKSFKISGTGAALALSFLMAAASTPVRAETKEVRIAEQFGLVYLPLTIMRDRNLLEKHAAQAGIKDLKVTWSRFSGSSQMTDAILSGSLDFASGAYANMAVLWDKTKGAIKAVAPVGIGPVYLVTVDPRIKSIKDFGGTDKIALPAVKVSTQALILQMAAAKEFGLENHAKLDINTVGMGHPDAVAMLSSGKTEVKSHFSAPPFQQLEMNAGARKVLDSYEVFGGPHGSAVVYAPVKFHSANPKTFKAFVAAYKDAVDLINAKPQEAAEIYKRATNDKASVEEIARQLQDPQVVAFTMAPLNLTKISDFMHATKRLQSKPATWQDVFFPELQSYVKDAK